MMTVPYEPVGEDQPAWRGDEDPLDLAPAGVGGRNLQCRVTRTQLLRDVYYVATRNGLGPDDYLSQINTGHGTEYPDPQSVSRVFEDPRTWDSTMIFKARQKVDFRLDKDQFFPMGDNSPQSLDGRLWGAPAYVERDLLTGKALMVYWPHYWNAPIPFLPNVGRMRLIH
jgi:signal peptidase I